MMGLAVAIQNSAECASLASPRQSPLGGRLKRSFDLLAASLAILFLAPLLLILAGVIYCLDGGPVIIRHTRLGRGGEKFGCLKFRTMVNDADIVLRDHLAADPKAAQEWDDTQKLCHDPRITKIGSVLRKTSLDELPQIYNIWRGDMSFVGPRPIVEAEISKYGPYWKDYCRARPGLTGAWQVNGRNDVDYGTRVMLDSEYVANWSFRRDLTIIVMTIPAVIKARGVY